MLSMVRVVDVEIKLAYHFPCIQWGLRIYEPDFWVW